VVRPLRSQAKRENAGHHDSGRKNQPSSLCRRGNLSRVRGVAEDESDVPAGQARTAREGRRDDRAGDISAAASQGEETVKASISIALETLWTNRAELQVEAELDNPHSQTNQEIVALMFDAARRMVEEARGENERTLFSQEALNERYRELDEREARLDEREKRLGTREAAIAEHTARVERREEQADTREREQMEREVHAERQAHTEHEN
jgi:hypothetical protein